MVYGALLGALAGTIAVATAQGRLWLNSNAHVVSGGNPQGTDLLTYFSMCRAVWRSGNGITYSYPYDLYWPMPAVLFHLPITLLACLGKAVGLPAAFEAGRIAGAAGTGAALGALGCMFPRGAWRKGFYIAVAFGGAMLSVSAVWSALRIAGLNCFTELHEYTDEGYGDLLWWLPFLSQNLRMPLECLYHAMVVGALACLVFGRYKWAWALGLAVWASNPFAAVALHSAVVPWLVWCTLEAKGGARRRLALNTAAWLAVNAGAVVYYSWFLQQWEVMRDLHDIYRSFYNAPLPLGRLALLTLPWVAGLVAAVVVPALRRAVWGRPRWRLFALLACAQIVLMQQGALIGERSMQAYHYNRGYLQLGLVITGLRVMLLVANRGGRPWVLPAALRPWHVARGRARRAVVALCVVVGVTLPDSALFGLYLITRPNVAGLYNSRYAELVRAIPADPAPMLVYVEAGMLEASYITATTPHIAYMADETMVVPHVAQRAQYIASAWKGENGGFAGLGIDYIIVATNDENLPRLEEQGWTRVRVADYLSLYRSPATRSGGNPPLP